MTVEELLEKNKNQAFFVHSKLKDRPFRGFIIGGEGRRLAAILFGRVTAFHVYAESDAETLYSLINEYCINFLKGFSAGYKGVSYKYNSTNSNDHGFSYGISEGKHQRWIEENL